MTSGSAVTSIQKMGLPIRSKDYPAGIGLPWTSSFSPSAQNRAIHFRIGPERGCSLIKYLGDYLREGLQQSTHIYNSPLEIDATLKIMRDMAAGT